MTDASIVILVAAIAPTIASITAAILAIIAARRSTAHATTAVAAAVAADAKVDTLISKADEIHTQTNSNLARLTAANEVALSTIAELRTQIATMTATADKLAATRPPQ